MLYCSILYYYCDIICYTICEWAGGAFTPNGGEARKRRRKFLKGAPRAYVASEVCHGACASCHTSVLRAMAALAVTLERTHCAGGMNHTRPCVSASVCVTDAMPGQKGSWKMLL